MLQPFHDIFVLILYNGLFQLFPELFIAIEISRHDKVKYTPQVTEAVLYRSSRQRKTVDSLQDVYKRQVLEPIL